VCHPAPLSLTASYLTALISPIIAPCCSLLRESLFVSANGDRHGVPNIGIVITDGKSNEHQEDTINQAQLTRAAGVRLVAVGITEQVDAAELLGISGDKDLVVEVAKFAELSNYLKNIVSLACVTPPPSGR